MAVRALVVVVALSVAATAAAKGNSSVSPPRPIHPAVFARLLEAVRAEPFTDAKLGRLREVEGGRAWLLDAAQASQLLDAFDFWSDRLEALRLMPLVDAAVAAAAVLRFFDPAPDSIRRDAERVLRQR